MASRLAPPPVTDWKEIEEPKPLRSGFSLGRFLGLEITLDPSWLLIFALITFSLYASLGRDYPGWNPGAYVAGALVASLAFFASILIHEISHSLVARRAGIGVDGITLFFFGGVSRLKDEPKRPLDEFWMALAGPLTSAVLGVAFIGLERLVPRQSLAAGITAWLGFINLALAAFNLLPGFPLDGGRVFRAVAWWFTKDLRRATRIAALVGSLIAYGLILGGILFAFVAHDLVQGLWFGFLGWFLLSAAQKSVAELEISRVLGRFPVSSVMRRDCPRVPPEERLDEFVEEFVLASGERCYLVVEKDGTLRGLVTLHEVKAHPRESWPTMTVSDIMVPLGRLRSTAPQASLLGALKEMNESGVNQLPVVEGGFLRGILTREDLLRRMAVHLELGSKGKS